MNRILLPRILTIFNLKGLDSFGELEPFVLQIMAHTPHRLVPDDH